MDGFELFLYIKKLLSWLLHFEELLLQLIIFSTYVGAEITWLLNRGWLICIILIIWGVIRCGNMELVRGIILLSIEVGLIYWVDFPVNIFEFVDIHYRVDLNIRKALNLNVNLWSANNIWFWIEFIVYPELVYWMNNIYWIYIISQYENLNVKSQTNLLISNNCLYYFFASRKASLVPFAGR
jgi:hypothetical protein